MVLPREDDPGDFETAERAHEEAVAAWQVGEPDEPGNQARIARSDARFFAELQLPFGPQLLAWRHGGDLHNDYVSVNYRAALEDLFGHQADAVCAKRHLQLDAETRLKLLQQIGQSVILGTARLKQTSAGDFSPDPHLARFPSFDGARRVTVADLFERWCIHHKTLLEASTIRRYTPSMNSLAAFLKDKDVRRIDQDDIWRWADHRRDADGVAAQTINRNDLVAAASVFGFAMTRSGERLRQDNPVQGVKLDVPKAKKKREKRFRDEEVRAILTLARSVEIGGRYPRASASRRWAPWICAYLGCRIQEVCWLRKEDFAEEGGIAVVDFRQTKTGNARRVPLHDALIEEGLRDFVKGASEGYLFVGDRERGVGATRTQQEQRASQIAEWIQDKLGLEEGVDPNHGWRHTWISLASARSVGIDKRFQNIICGHSGADVSDDYHEATIKELKEVLDRFPRYNI